MNDGPIQKLFSTILMAKKASLLYIYFSKRSCKSQKVQIWWRQKTHSANVSTSLQPHFHLINREGERSVLESSIKIQTGRNHRYQQLRNCYMLFHESTFIGQRLKHINRGVITLYQIQKSRMYLTKKKERKGEVRADGNNKWY